MVNDLRLSGNLSDELNEKRCFTITYFSESNMVNFEYYNSLFFKNKELYYILGISLAYDTCSIPEAGDLIFEVDCIKPDHISEKYVFHSNYDNVMEVERSGNKPILSLLDEAISFLSASLDEIVTEIAKVENPQIFNLREAFEFFKEDYELLTDHMFFGDDNENSYLLQRY